jgi:hypothetical protein
VTVRKEAYQEVLLGSENVRGEKMLGRDQQHPSSEGQWQTVAEFPLRGEAACADQAAAMVAEILTRARVPDRVLIEAKEAVARRMEELSRPAADQPQRSFTILVRTQSARLLEMPANAASHQESRLRPKGWGFFLTDRITTDAEMGDEVHHLVVSLHLYQEGHPA